MTIFSICYDLRNESGSQDYEPLWDALREKDCQHTQDSVWLGSFTNTAKEVHDYFKSFMDNDDRLMVAGRAEALPPRCAQLSERHALKLDKDIIDIAHAAVSAR